MIEIRFATMGRPVAEVVQWANENGVRRLEVGSIINYH
jgi:hypothetical protein